MATISNTNYLIMYWLEVAAGNLLVRYCQGSTCVAVASFLQTALFLRVTSAVAEGEISGAVEVELLLVVDLLYHQMYDLCTVGNQIVMRIGDQQALGCC